MSPSIVTEGAGWRTQLRGQQTVVSLSQIKLLAGWYGLVWLSSLTKQSYFCTLSMHVWCWQQKSDANAYLLLADFETFFCNYLSNAWSQLFLLKHLCSNFSLTVMSKQHLTLLFPLGEALLDQEVIVSYMYSSPALRCIQTAQHVLQGKA